MPRKSPVRVPRAALATLLAIGSACSPSALPPPPGPAPVDRLAATLAGASVTGRAAELAAGKSGPRVRTLVDLDFEQGDPGLTPFSDGPEPTARRPAVGGVVRDPLGADRALCFGPGTAGGVTLESRPLPVEPGAGFTLRWSVYASGPAADSGDAGVPDAAVRPLFHAVGAHHRDVARYLADPERRQKSWRETPEDPVVGPGAGPAWVEHVRRLTAPPGATALVLSFDPAAGDLGAQFEDRTRGTVCFDDVRLEVDATPLVERYRAPPQDGAPGHPLRVRVELPAEDGGAEARDAILAPAPSTLTFSRSIPPAGRLTLGTAVLAEGVGPPSGAHRFTVRIRDGQGGRVSVASWTMRPAHRSWDRRWVDRSVDLSQWSGQPVRIELETAVDGEGGEPGAALWGEPVLSSPEGGGRLVVIAVLDTFAAGHLSAHGYSRPTTPFLARLAAGATLFEAAYAPAPWTLPSIASLWTGVGPERHGAGARTWQPALWRGPLPASATTLAERLRAAGFDTAGFVNNPYLTPAFGLDQGFSAWRDYGLGTRTGAGAAGVALASRWLRAHQGNDRLLVVHFMDAHGPYRPPRRHLVRFGGWVPWGSFGWALSRKEHADLAEAGPAAIPSATRRELADRYDAALSYVDEQVSRLHDAVLLHSGASERLFVVTADHGEEHFEHGGFEHGHQVYDELIRVPLVIERSPPSGPPRRVAARVRLVDVLPTVLEWLGLPVPEGLDGESLAPFLGAPPRAGEAARPVFAGTTLYGTGSAAAVLDGWKYVYTMAGADRPRPRVVPRPRHQFFDLGADRGEQTDRSRAASPAMRRSHDRLEAHLRAGLQGRHVLLLDGGGQVHRWEGELRLPGDGRWSPYYEDLVAPLAGGEAGALAVTAARGRFHFQVTAERALLAARPDGTPSEGLLGVVLVMDGLPWGSALRLVDGRHPCRDGAPCTVPSADLTGLPAGLPPPGRGPPFAVLLRSPDPEGGHGATAQQAAAGREGLRALGYVE